MVDILGPEAYFEPVTQPDTQERAEMEAFFENFTPFFIADLECRIGAEGHRMADGTALSLEAARCAADELGVIRFGEIFLDRVWVPTAEQHAEAAATFTECGSETDFLQIPPSMGTLQGDDLECMLAELTNHDDAFQTSLRGFSDIGQATQLKAGDLAAFLFGAQRCGIPLTGAAADHEITNAAAQCLTANVDTQIYAQGSIAVAEAFDYALLTGDTCFE